MDQSAYTTHFTNLGKLVKLYNLLYAVKATVRTSEEELAVILNDNSDEVDFLKDCLVATRSFVHSGLDGVMSQLVAAAQNYWKEAVRKDLGYTGNSIDLISVLEAMYEDMVEGGITCDGSAVALTAATFDPDNTGSYTVTLAGATQLVTDEFFECERDATDWEVRGEPDEHGVLSSRYTTAGAAQTMEDSNDQDLFTLIITELTAGTGYYITGDTDTEVTTMTFTGAVKGTNTDANGDVFFQLDKLTETEDGDNNNQLSDWANITGAELGVNVDTDGKIHVSIVDEGGGDFHVNFYSDAARSALVAHTATYSAGGAQALVEDNSSGLGGSITIDAATAADVDINCILALHRIRVYKESGKSNLVAIGGILTTTGTITLVEQNSSGLTGTAVLDYTDGETTVQWRVGFAAASGDKIYFTTSSDEAGTFVEFFRKEMGVAVNVDLVGGETIPDSLAE